MLSRYPTLRPSPRETRTILGWRKLNETVADIQLTQRTQRVLKQSFFAPVAAFA
jgi:hypothetical protein